MDRPFILFSMIVILLASALIVQYKITGDITAQVGVNVACLVALSLPVSTVDFGTMMQGSTDNTTDNSPPPLIMQNDGGALIDITIARANASAPMFNGTGGGDNSNSFQFKARDPNATSFNASASIMTFTPVPGTAPLTIVRQLRFADGHKQALVDLLIDVPYDEPPGMKSEFLDFIAVQSNGTDCGINIPSQSECIEFDLSKTNVQDDRLVHTEFENICSFPVTITQARFTWTTSAYIEELKIDGGTQWKYDCAWSCSPTGLQPSGTLLDFGTADRTINGDKTKKIKDVKFNASVANSTFTIELIMQDGSSAYIGPFSPP